MGRYLIVANQTLGGDELVELVKKRAKAEPSEFFIVVPATPVMEMVVGAEAMSVIGGSTVAISTPEHARELAQERLDVALAQLAEAGAKVEGHVGDRNPMRAVETAMKGRKFDEIIVSTLPRRVSRWLRQDLPRRLENKTQLPVTHVGGER
jgi:GABA permease